MTVFGPNAAILRLPRVVRWERMLLRMGETNTIRGVWLGGLAIMWSYPLATLVPSVVLSAIGEVPTYLIDDRRVLDLVLSLVTAYLAYYLYLAYAEGIVRKVRRGEQPRPGGCPGRSDRGLTLRSRGSGGRAYRGYHQLSGGLLARRSRGVVVHALVTDDARDPRGKRGSPGRDAT